MSVTRQDLDFQHHTGMSCSMISGTFVDIGGIIDHHCVHFLFITSTQIKIFPEHVIKFVSDLRQVGGFL